LREVGMASNELPALVIRRCEKLWACVGFPVPQPPAGTGCWITPHLMHSDRGREDAGLPWQWYRGYVDLSWTIPRPVAVTP